MLLFFFLKHGRFMAFSANDTMPMTQCLKKLTCRTQCIHYQSRSCRQSFCLCWKDARRSCVRC